MRHILMQHWQSLSAALTVDAQPVNSARMIKHKNMTNGYYQKIKTAANDYPVSLFKLCHHNNGGDLLFPDHTPEVIERLDKWTLITVHM